MSGKGSSGAVGCVSLVGALLLIIILGIPLIFFSCGVTATHQAVEISSINSSYFKDAYEYTSKLKALGINYEWTNFLCYAVENNSDIEAYDYMLIPQAYAKVINKESLNIDEDNKASLDKAVGSLVRYYIYPYLHPEIFYFHNFVIDPNTGNVIDEPYTRTFNVKRYKSNWGKADYFPLANGYTYSFSDDFGNERTYKEHTHEGNDIMTKEGTPIISVEEGIIEKQGWDELGGWRIGIRSLDGYRYYYYAHMSRYSSSDYIGKKVDAGDVIGYVGSSGYGTEGTTGKFEPHLHFGIEVTYDKSIDPVWIDPYATLKFLEENTIDVEPINNNEFVRKLNIEN